MVLHKVSACRDRTSDRTVVYSKQPDQLFHHVSYRRHSQRTHSLLEIGIWNAEEN